MNKLLYGIDFPRIKKGRGFMLMVLIICFSALDGTAKITLPSVIGNHMVLQQKDRVAIWGKASPGATVAVTTSWNQRHYQVKVASDSSWRLKVQTPEAGGPYQIRIGDGQQSILLKDILIGEVWVCSGQSNMEMPVWGFYNQPVLGANDVLAEASNHSLRLIRYERALSRTPEFDCPSTGWQVSDAEVAGKFSAVGFQFALRLQQKLNIPVGIIMSTWGGTMIEGWMSESSMKLFPSDDKTVKPVAGKMNKNEPSLLYNAMIHPFAGFGIKGMIWYQGEQNRCNPKIYDQLMEAMVADWRKKWAAGEWPFYYVQIAPYQYRDTIGPAAPLREAQARASHRIPKSGMVVSMDAGERNAIHPRKKSVISKRLLYWALANDYGYKGLAYQSPEYDALQSPVQIEGTKVRISFTHASRGLMTDGSVLNAFEVAGADRRFYPAQARIKGKFIELESDQVTRPVAVRYGFKDYAECHLFNVEGLPVAPFRTDNWAL